ncbi:DUF4351 domain-containing protein [Pleurocapsa sp. PCC 7319]|uniref:DUF4351 domain-containing protein n=1 Tax=Pleurocapsa sp. PCC 7319 TaxID=118161 RepID=UPI00037F6BEE|nr:DUF4351 domain-containing protein [Pleurocapsa sp. PCC 7319]
MPNINHDQLFKELLTTFFIEFLELFFPSVLEFLDVETISFVDKELFTNVTKGKKKIMDVVALAKFQKQNHTFLIHIENQARNDPQYNQQMFRYYCSLFLKYDRPIYPIVIFAYDHPKRADRDDFSIDFPEGLDRYFPLQFKYKVVQLNRLNWRDFLQRPNPVAAALMAKMRITPKDRPLVKAECLRLMVTLELNPAKMQLISGFVDTYLRLNQNEQQVFQSELDKMELQQQEQIMQITTSWKEEGIAEGLVQGQSNTILRLLNRKLGTLDNALASRIKSLNPDQLDNLTEDLLDFQTLDDLNQWLETH